MALPKIHAGGFVGLLLLLICRNGCVDLCVYLEGTADAEIQMGLLVVAAITTLMTVLFILAAGFSCMSLADPKQPLALPEGSIRAMIALALIMVFILFGIYLFRMVGAGSSTYVGNMDKVPDPQQYKGKLIRYDKLVEEKTGTVSYDVWVISAIDPDGKALAQQLITTVGTLVVAVAGFYFGSSTTNSLARRAGEELAAGQAAAANPTITDVTPKEGLRNQQLAIEIAGTGFKSPKAVRLHRGSETMECSEILANKTKIQCKVTIDKAPDGKWDVLVENEDGKQVRSTEVFTIKPA